MTLYAGSLAEFAPPPPDRGVIDHKADMRDANARFLDALDPSRVERRQEFEAREALRAMQQAASEAIRARDEARQQRQEARAAAHKAERLLRLERKRMERAHAAAALGRYSRPIVQAVSAGMDLPLDAITGVRGSSRNVAARALTARLLRDLETGEGLPRFTLAQIGKILGGRDHSTVCYLLETFPARCTRYPEIASLYLALSEGADASGDALPAPEWVQP